MSEGKVHKLEFNYVDFVQYALDSKRSNKANQLGCNSSHKTNSEAKQFTLTDSFEQAVDYAIHGWDAGIKELNVKEDIIIQGSTH